MSSKQSSSAHRLTGMALGVLAGIGGFSDTGGVIAATQAGAKFHYGLVWAVLFGYIGFSVFAEMSGRIAIAAAQPTYEIIRARLGRRLAAVPVIANMLIHVLTMAVDFMGMSLALEVLTGVHYRFWTPILAIALAAALWWFSFSPVDGFAAVFGVTMLIAVAAMIKLPQDWTALGAAFFRPRIPESRPVANYLFATAAMLGAFMTPYQFDFYSSGAVEENWTGRDLLQNRIVSMTGALFGALVSLGLMVGSRTALSAAGSLETLRAAAKPAAVAFGAPGFYLFFIGVFFVSLAASVELCLSGGYAVCQYFGWDWGKSVAPKDAPVFNAIFLAQIAIGAAIVLTGVNPIHFSLLVMVLAAAALPFTFVPLTLIANDRQFMGAQRNTFALNAVAVVIVSVLVLITFSVPVLLVLTHGRF